jgi:biotin transport system ATP-binding protein
MISNEMRHDTNAPPILVENLTARLGDTLALNDVSLRLDSARIAVIGSNGSGKSTFARLLGGIARPTAGSIRVHDVDTVKESVALRRLVSIVFSNPDAQIVMPTVSEDVAFSLRGSGASKFEIAERVATALAEFNLTDLADRSAHELSGGQKQLLALCGALIRRPALLIADEPTAYLDARNSEAVAGHLMNPSAEHQLVLITHDLDLAARCDSALLFDEGQVVAQGEPAEVIDAYRTSLRR